MLDERLVQELDKDTSREHPEMMLSLEEVLRLINRLDNAGMLTDELAPRGNWILQSGVPEDEFARVLQQHLSKRGWQRVVEAMHQHNRANSGSQWDLAETSGFMAALNQALGQHQAAVGVEAASTQDLTSDMWQQVKGLMEEQLAPTNLTDWLLSPRALVKRLSARGRRAHTETQIEDAVTHARLQAARIVGTDAERDVALTRVDQLRRELGNQLDVFCEEHGLDRPQPYSREEAYCLHLLNAYFVALAEAEGTIAERGAALAKRQISLEGERAAVRMDSQLLPTLVTQRREVNPLRESLFRERVRHRVAMVIGGLFGAIAGGVWSVVEAVSDVFISAVARYAIVLAPALLIFLLTLVAQTVSYDALLTLNVISEFLVRALWNGTLAFGTTVLVYGCWLYYQSRRNEGED
jgi:hypothetical protein